MSKVTGKDIRTLGEKLKDFKTSGDEIIINIERDEELFQDMKVLFNCLEILLSDYDFSKNELPAEKSFKINPPTDISYNCWTNMLIADGMFRDKPGEEISELLWDVKSRKMKDTVIEDLRRKLPVFEKKDEIIKAV
uniref:Imm63 domain-containing protein n=1 Tax=Strongyloides papillosus TaxID=174720 RepID=A0A0N5C633_STREA